MKPEFQILQALKTGVSDGSTQTKSQAKLCQTRTYNDEGVEAGVRFDKTFEEMNSPNVDEGQDVKGPWNMVAAEIKKTSMPS